ncbi:MAG: hypothetical protein U9O65_06445 [Thermotogota bacterium]|nr:hypothetical protein [Thermotogota bacterium]
MKKLLVILIFVSIIGGCATAKQTYTSDGQKGYVIDCSGSALNWGMCYEKAGKICGERVMLSLKKAVTKER